MQREYKAPDKSKHRVHEDTLAEARYPKSDGNKQVYTLPLK